MISKLIDRAYPFIIAGLAGTLLFYIADSVIII